MIINQFTVLFLALWAFQCLVTWVVLHDIEKDIRRTKRNLDIFWEEMRKP